jgi:hypothetical protein
VSQFGATPRRECILKIEDELARIETENLRAESWKENDICRLIMQFGLLSVKCQRSQFQALFQVQFYNYRHCYQDDTAKAKKPPWCKLF